MLIFNTAKQTSERPPTPKPKRPGRQRLGFREMCLLLACLILSNEAPTRQHGDPAHYELQFDSDPAVCKPLARAYNHFLNQGLNDLRHGRVPPITEVNNPASSTNTDFEVARALDFRAYGFRLPPIATGTSSWGAFRADIFNDGSPKLVAIQTSSAHLDPFTRITVLPSGFGTDAISSIERGPNGLLLDQNSGVIMRAGLGSWFSPG